MTPAADPELIREANDRFKHTARQYPGGASALNRHLVQWFMTRYPEQVKEAIAAHWLPAKRIDTYGT